MKPATVPATSTLLNVAAAAIRALLCMVVFLR
jgi:hypothetical protein